MISEGGKNYFQSLIEYEVDKNWDIAKEKVNTLLKENPNADIDILVNKIIDDKSFWAVVIGVGLGGLETIPSIGQIIAVGSVAPEAVYLAKMQVDIAMAIALLYNHSLDRQNIQHVVVACFVLALGADFIKKEIKVAAVHITKQVIVTTIKKFGEKQFFNLLKKIGIKATQKGILKKVPVISIPLNAGLNYSQIQAFGWVVKKFLSPSFVMCGECGHQTGRLNKFCPQCGTGL
ncbi:MAG: hypothetical protein ACE5H1_08700 [Thermodesulfobacteriota bacterium]